MVGTHHSEVSSDFQSQSRPIRNAVTNSGQRQRRKKQGGANARGAESSPCRIEADCIHATVTCVDTASSQREVQVRGTDAVQILMPFFLLPRALSLLYHSVL